MSKKRKKSNKNISNNNAPNENSENDSNILNNNSNDNSVNESKIQKAQETDIYKFFKGIPPLTTVIFSILSVSLFFLVKFLYYLFHAGYLTKFNIDISYVDFSEITYMKIALTTAIGLLSMLCVKFFSSIWYKSIWKGFGLTTIFLFLWSFILLFNAEEILNILIISIILTIMVMIIPFIICIITTIKNKLKKSKKEKHRQHKILNKISKILKLEKIKLKITTPIHKFTNWLNSKNSDVPIFIILIIILLFSLYSSGKLYAKNKDEFNIINDSGKQYAVISEYKDRFICVECNISDDNKTITLNYKIQKQIPIQNTEYTIYKFDDWSSKNE